MVLIGLALAPTESLGLSRIRKRSKLIFLLFSYCEKMLKAFGIPLHLF